MLFYKVSVKPDRIAEYMIGSMKVYSFLVGKVSSVHLPPPILTPLLRAYSMVYGIDQEDLPRPLSEYSSFKDFFTRPPKEGLRPIDPRPEIVTSPVDAAILQTGEMDSPVPNTFKIKGRYYTLGEMIGKMSYWDFTGNDRKGFYILFYLNPGSCHRIHSPITGSITSFGFSPGTLYPVNTMGRKLVPDCHVKNAKVTLKLASPGDHVNIFLVLIGALAVGDITLTYNGRRVFNSRDRESLEIHAPAVPIKKGQEIGIFNLGSSVFMICYGRSGTGMNLIAREGDVSIGSGVIESEILKQEGGNG